MTGGNKMVIIKGKIQHKQIKKGKYPVIEVNQGNPRYPIEVSVSDVLYELLEVGDEFEQECGEKAYATKSGNGAYISHWVIDK